MISPDWARSAWWDVIDRAQRTSLGATGMVGGVGLADAVIAAGFDLERCEAIADGLRMLDWLLATESSDRHCGLTMLDAHIASGHDG